MPSYVVDNELIPQVVRLAHIPLSNNTFLPVDILAFGDNELRTHILAQILSVRESYYLTFLDQPVNSTGIYPIPYRAIDGRIHAVQMVVGNVVYLLARIEPKDLINNVNPPTNAYSFYFAGNNIVTLPTLPGGVLRTWFYITPSLLVPQAQCMQITVIADPVITVSSIPSIYTANVTVDFTQANPPFGILNYDQAILSVNTGLNTITFNSGVVPPNLAIGDFLSLANTSCIPQIPLAFHSVLAQRVSCKILESQGYMPKFQVAQAKLLEMEKAVTDIINPRDEGNPKKITPNRGLISPGPGRNGSFWTVAP